MASNFAGFMGKVIQIDLTSETVKEYLWTDRQRQLCLGSRQAGLGAVLGWKNLKAITVTGSKPIPIRCKTPGKEADTI